MPLWHRLPLILALPVLITVPWKGWREHGRGRGPPEVFWTSTRSSSRLGYCCRSACLRLTLGSSRGQLVVVVVVVVFGLVLGGVAVRVWQFDEW